MRALIVTNMLPSPARPAFGSFVQDQIEALERLDGVELEVLRVPSGRAGGYVRAAAGQLARRRGRRFDVVHAHYGLSAWPALAVAGSAHVLTLHGTDLSHPRTRAITLAALPALDLVATVSPALAGRLPSWVPERRRAVLPCGVALERFAPRPRAEARRVLGLPLEPRRLLFPADPARPEKRHDRARRLAREVGAELLSLGSVPPERVPLFVNAADAVLVPSEREGFGLAVLEALACGVPVLSTPEGIAPEALRDVPGTLCADYDERDWTAALRRILEDPDPRVEGRAAAARYSSDRMARRVLEAWRSLPGLGGPGLGREASAPHLYSGGLEHP